MWIMVNCETGLLWYARQKWVPCLLVCLKHAKVQYCTHSHFEAWDSSSADVVHPSPLLSLSCPDSWPDNTDILSTLNHRPLDPNALLDVSSCSADFHPSASLGASVSSLKVN